MNQKTVRIDNFTCAADGRKVETAFAFLNKVFHLTTATVELEHLIWFRFHRGYHECEYMVDVSSFLLDT